MWESDEWYFGELICIKCGHRSIHVWHCDTWLKDIECARCGEVGFMINTGQIIEDDLKRSLVDEEGSVTYEQ